MFLSELLRKDRTFGSTLNPTTVLQLERTTSHTSRKVPVTGKLNDLLKYLGQKQITKTQKTITHSYAVYYQVQQFVDSISFHDRFFCKIGNDADIRITPTAFSNFLYGLSFDLISYVRRIHSEAKAGHQAVNTVGDLFKNS
jgi:hypothetical protein